MFTEATYHQIRDHFRQTEPILADLMERHGYLTPLPTRNLFSHLIGAILGQKIRFRQARMLRGRLYQKLLTDCFQPADILELGLAGLLELGMDIPIAELIINVSQWVVALDQPFTQPEQLKQLQNEVKGIGPWTVHNTAIIWTLSSGEADAPVWDYLLTEDLIIRRVMKKLFPTSPTLLQQRTLAEGWSPYRGIVTWYLWREGS